MLSFGKVTPVGSCGDGTVGHASCAWHAHAVASVELLTKTAIECDLVILDMSFIRGVSNDLSWCKQAVVIATSLANQPKSRASPSDTGHSKKSGRVASALDVHGRPRARS